MNDWLRARNGWTLFLLNWAVVLTGGLLGYGASWTFSDYTESFVPSVPMLLGGTLFMALINTAVSLRRRRRHS